MKIMPCPLNGPRNIQEFICAGTVEPHPDPNRCSDDEWTEYVWLEENLAGVVREWWCHVATSYWFIAERNTVTDEILATYPADRVFSERVEFEPLPPPPEPAAAPEPRKQAAPPPPPTPPEAPPPPPEAAPTKATKEELAAPEPRSEPAEAATETPETPVETAPADDLTAADAPADDASTEETSADDASSRESKDPAA